MELKILKNEHYIDIANECDFKEGSKVFTASCFLNKNIDGEFKDFSVSEENEKIVKVMSCSFEMLEMLKDILEQREDGRDYVNLSDMRDLIKKATT